jgi:hypothetical protein
MSLPSAVIETQVVCSARILRVKVAGGFAVRVRFVLSATNELAADEDEAGLEVPVVAEALVDVDVVAAEDFSTDGFAAGEDCAIVGEGAAGGFTAGAGDCTAVVEGSGLEAAEFGAEPWER